MMATDPPTTAATARPRFVRPKDDRLLSGVCSGLARHLGIDVALVRTAAVILTLIGGVGVLIYIAALVLVPEEGTEQPFVRSGRLDEDDRAPLILGGLVLAAIVMGAGPLPWDWWDGGPWLLILGLGIAMVTLAARHDRKTGTPSVAPDATAAAATATWTAATPVADEPTAVTEVHDADEATLAFGPPEPPEPEGPRSRVSGRIVAGLVLLVLGGLGLAITALDADLAWDTAFAIGVLACGVGAIAAAPFGGARAVLLIGFLTAAVGGFVAAADLDLKGGIGERLERPASVTAFPADGYRLGIGSQRIDLRDVTFPFGTTTLKVRQGVGELRVLVPADVALVARGRATGGDIRILDEREDGGSPDLEVESSVRSERRLVLDAKLTFGEIRIVQDGDNKGATR